ncbi:MAG TPA: hypothetical protein VMM14_01025 [Acidimicrobiia bacterium]|nr:hypothetical protein [Acidimicrobiia bacterium]
MRSHITYVWGVAADESGIIQHTHYGGKALPGGGLRAWKQVELAHEPASAYGSVHPAPMPMRWGHKQEVGRIVALRRAHGRLLALAETKELEPADLDGLTERCGALRWSTSTDNRRGDLLRIDEISLTASPATVGLPAVGWYRLGVSKGNMPRWVQEELKRADKLEFRQRHELRVNDLDYERNPYSDPDRYERDVGLVPGGQLEGRHMTINGERVPMEYRPSRIVSVEGRPVGR